MCVGGLCVRACACVGLYNRSRWTTKNVMPDVKNALHMASPPVAVPPRPLTLGQMHLHLPYLSSLQSGARQRRSERKDIFQVSLDSTDVADATPVFRIKIIKSSFRSSFTYVSIIVFPPTHRILSPHFSNCKTGLYSLHNGLSQMSFNCIAGSDCKYNFCRFTYMYYRFHETYDIRLKHPLTFISKLHR